MYGSERSGCIVVVEHGARWPERVFERLVDREGVAMVSWLPDEPVLWFLTRLAHGCSLLERNRIRIRSAVFACSGEQGADPKARKMVIRSIASRLARDGESRVTLVGDGAEGTTPTDLVALADPIMVAEGAAPVRVDVVSEDVLSARNAALAPRSGVRTSRPSSPPVAWTA